MSKSLSAAVVAAFVGLSAFATVVLGVEPVAADYLQAAEEAGLPCISYGEVSWMCDEPIDSTEDRSFTVSVEEGDGGWFAASVGRWWADPRPLEADVLALMDRFIVLALGDDAAAQAWLGSAHDQRRDTDTFERGDWLLTWFADWEDPGPDLQPGIQLVLNYNPGSGGTEPPPSADGVDACSLLTAEEVEAVTGLAAQPGVTKETHAAGQIGCGWGTEPYEVQVAIMPSLDGPAVDGLGDSGHPVDGVGDGAEWWWCEECLQTDSSSSTNHLVVAAGMRYIDIGFDPTTDAAADDSELVQETHREWAIELARLILPRLTDQVPAPSIAPGEPAEGPAATAEPGAPPTGPAGDGAGAPSFARSVPSPARVSTDPIVVLQSAALAALLVFLMPFPSQLFNSTLEEHEDEVRRWLRLDRLGAAARGVGAFWASWPGVALFTLLAALLYGFLDPGFGIDIGSVATFLGMLVGIVLVTAAFAVPVIVAHRRHGDRPSLKVVPISLLIGVVCVLLSRLTSFQPGYLYGLLIGLAFARELSAAEEGRATALGALVMLGVAVVAWVVLGVVPEGDGFGLVVARTALAALLVAGLEGVVFGLLPMRFLPGQPLFEWNRAMWAGLLGIGAFAFFHILINPASGYLSDTSRTPLFTILALLVGFGAVSVAFWAWFRFRPDPPATTRSTLESHPPGDDHHRRDQ
jgi:hypothetical protein